MGLHEAIWVRMIQLEPHDAIWNPMKQLGPDDAILGSMEQSRAIINNLGPNYAI